MTKAAEFLKKLRVRSGFQMTTYVSPLKTNVYVDFWFNRTTSKFALTLSWSGKSKVVELIDSDIESKSKSMWAADKTYSMTESCISRIAPGLDSALNAIHSKLANEAR